MAGTFKHNKNGAALIGQTLPAATNLKYLSFLPHYH